MLLFRGSLGVDLGSTQAVDLLHHHYTIITTLLHCDYTVFTPFLHRNSGSATPNIAKVRSRGSSVGGRQGDFTRGGTNSPRWRSVWAPLAQDYCPRRAFWARKSADRHTSYWCLSVSIRGGFCFLRLSGRDDGAGSVGDVLPALHLLLGLDKDPGVLRGHAESGHIYRKST